MTVLNDIRDIAIIVFCCMSLVLLGSSCIQATQYEQTDDSTLQEVMP